MYDSNVSLMDYWKFNNNNRAAVHQCSKDEPSVFSFVLRVWVGRDFSERVVLFTIFPPHPPLLLWL